METWSAEEILPAPADDDMERAAEEDMKEERAVKCCGFLYLLRRLFRRKKKAAVREAAKTDNVKEKVIEDIEEETIEEETVTRAIVHAEETMEDDGENGNDEEKDFVADQEMKTCEDEALVEAENKAENNESDDGKEKPTHTSKKKRKRKKRKVKVEKAPLVKADEDLAVGVKQVSGEASEAPKASEAPETPEATEGDSEGWTVVACKKKRPRKVRAQPSLPKETVAETPEDPDPPKRDSEGKAVVGRGKNRPKKVKAPSLPEVKAAIESPRRQQLEAKKGKQRAERAKQQRALDSVRRSWQEEEKEATLAVAPHMRRYIVGPRGATLREVCQEFAGVRVSVPPPSDTRTATIRLCGPARQVPAALARLEALLRQAEVIEAQVAVTPRQRCHVVGPAGATVRRLLQEFPDVQVRVPPATDKVSRTVLLRGPRTQVAGAEAFVRGCLEAAGRTAHAAHAGHRHAHHARRHAHNLAHQ